MTKLQIKQLIENKITEDGMIETGIEGVYLFRISNASSCAPVVYQPAIIAILNGTKEAILDGRSHKYNSDQYLSCTMTMPVEAGTPNASPESPLLGVYISLDNRIMTELVMETQHLSVTHNKQINSQLPPGIALSKWDDSFTNALLRLLQLERNSSDLSILSAGRLRELYYSVLKGEAGESFITAFGIGNEISKTIMQMSSNLDQQMTVDAMAKQAGMSRAVFHKKFKEATMMSPIQFVKSVRLNSAAMKIATGVNITDAAFEVGYVSTSQFSREFKRIYGQSPKQWSMTHKLPSEMNQVNKINMNQFQKAAGLPANLIK